MKKISPKAIQPNHRTELDMWNELWCETKFDSENLIEAKSPNRNPIAADSIGPDMERPRPEWVSEDLLKEIEELKSRLFELENKANAKMGGGEKWHEKPQEPNQSKILSDMDSIRKQIDKVSDELGMKYEP